MRPLLHLLGQCEVTVDDAPVPTQITRKHWYVLGLVATAENCNIGREDLMEIVWPLSDDKSRNVLLYTWRRSIAATTTPFNPDAPILITEDDVSINPNCLLIDYQECLSLAKIVLTSDDAHTVLEAGTAFDAIAQDKVLLPSFTTAFVRVREHFDKQRRAVLRRTWQAEAHLQHESQPLVSQFEIRLRRLGDENAIGVPAIPFKGIANQAITPLRKGISLSSASQLVVSVILAIIIAAPIVIGSLNTPPKMQREYIHGSKVDLPITDLSHFVMFQVNDPRIKRSAATALSITEKDRIIAAGTATLLNSDHQTIIAMLTMSGKDRWVAKFTDDKGIQTTPKQILSTESGRIYVASELLAGPGNARKLKPGRYLAVNVLTRDGERLFERVHPEALDGIAFHRIRLTADLKGGIHAFAVSARGQTSVTLHVPAGRPTEVAAPLSGYPKSFQITDAISDDKGHVFLIGHLPVKTSRGLRMDWFVQAFDKSSKTLWTCTVPGSVSQASVPVRGAINAMGNLVTYGPLPTPNKRNRGRKVATMVTMSPASGAIIARECFDTEDQNPDFTLYPLTIGNSAFIAVTKQSPDADNPFSIHRFGIAATDTALTLSMRFPGKKRVERIVSFYINKNGVVAGLLQPTQEESSSAALTYTRIFFMRGIQTGALSAVVPHRYNEARGEIVAGHYDNKFCVYDFSKLP